MIKPPLATNGAQASAIATLAAANTEIEQAKDKLTFAETEVGQVLKALWDSAKEINTGYTMAKNVTELMGTSVKAVLAGVGITLL